ncbi:RcpC/CpaB family pilus assembly protein [Enterococcus sp. AZ180]|uniref:RcpC/CpaB family pilus assembly protein n=1 Tax=Enterococcus sp. AZ180 TaxID=2774961 RepID=UPI003F24B5DC
MKKNKFTTIIIIAAAVVLSIVVSYVLITSNKMTTAWVPKEKISAGQTIKDKDLKKISIPVKTPSGYIKNKDFAVGQKAKVNLGQGQLLYQQQFGTTADITKDSSVNKDYVMTTMQIPDDRAVGGIITIGDFVDVMIQSSNGEIPGFNTKSEVGSSRDDISSLVQYVLANVKILDVISPESGSGSNATADNQQGTGGTAQTSSSNGKLYLVALSYDDAKKLRQAEGIQQAKLWLNLSPKQNEKDAPLLQQMAGQSFSGLHDASKPVQDKEGNIIAETVKQEDKK